MSEKKQERSEPTGPPRGVPEDDRRGALKAGLFFVAAIAAIVLLKIVLGY